MPEIAEVFRAADYIRQHLVGRTLASVKALHDENVFGKVGTSAAEIEKSITGKKIVGAGQQGKYFWIAMASPPHLLCHFGMNGWFHIKGIPTFYYKDTKKDKAADKEWPPRNWKILFETKPEGKDKSVLEAAFVDSRRFARVRLIDVPIEDIRKHSPLKENGPDPNTDKEIVTREWLAQLCHRKKAPIKAVLLDQANISGIGNWVGDEILYQARIHPEQYSNTLSEDQISELYKQLMEVVKIAIETKSDSDKFPKTWLFKHRWGKGRKSVYEMPNGDEITYVTVGGRTSAIVPTLQKNTGLTKDDVKDEDMVEPAISSGPSKNKRKRKIEEVAGDDEDKEEQAATPAKRGRTTKSNAIVNDDKTVAEAAEDEAKERKPAKRGRKAKANVAITTKATESSKTRRAANSITAEDLPPTATAEEVAETENPIPKADKKPAPRGRKVNTQALTTPKATTEAEPPAKNVDEKAGKGQSRARPPNDKIVHAETAAAEKVDQVAKLEKNRTAATKSGVNGTSRRRSVRLSAL